MSSNKDHYYTRIGVILDSEYTIDARVQNECEYLATEGFEIHVLCMNTSTTLPQKEERNGVTISRICMPKIIYKLSALAHEIPFYSNWLARKTTRFIGLVKPEIVHAHDIRGGIAAMRAAKQFKLPFVIDLHENRPEIMKEYRFVQRFPGKFLINLSKWKKAEKKLLQEADRSIVVTQEAKDHYTSEYTLDPSKISVVPNSVRTAFYAINFSGMLDDHAKKYTLIYIGDTSKRRGLLTAVNSLPELKKHIENIELLIIGTSSFDPELKAHIEDLNVSAQVSIVGWQDAATFPNYLVSSNVGICLIHKNLHHHTTYANKLFQYMSFGLPLVVSDCLAQKNLVEENNCGLVIKDQSSEEFTKAILQLYSNSTLSQELGENGRNAILREWTWEKKAKNLKEVFKSQ
ncbi:MAG: glycosyltransferase family 4 protein [Flavobacteriales bacterium]